MIDMTRIMTSYMAMINLNINEIKANLSNSLAKVCKGETIAHA
ncbi:MAG: hypothetical protein R2860_17255 [Desulfobacterales bacterium]|jgi:hypothetical protein